MNKVALITGSTSGIGLGIADGFAKQGYNLMLHGLEEHGPQIAVDMSEKYNISTSFSNADMRKAEAVENLVHRTIEEFGGLHVLINNAGIQYVSQVEDFPNSRYESIIAINMNAAFYAAKAAWTTMKKQRFGRIINVSSAHGLRASEYKIAYVTAKHGIMGMTKVLALEGAPYNISCNAICPGYVKTPLVENQIQDQAKAHQMTEAEVVEKVMLKKQAVKQFVPLETIADTALLLAKETSATITGTAFTLDGGWTAQ